MEIIFDSTVEDEWKEMIIKIILEINNVDYLEKIYYYSKAKKNRLK